ncbi:ABC transporter ATP-binding protein [Candidatus Microgenomates bacterium]|nr:ABC transporter ATP-binding protein [Candidatus Microgenomates bacterium]
MLVKLTSVSKIYQMGGLEVKALDNVSLEIKKGEFVAIQGPSGSGKSTLMHLIGCLDTPTKGKIVFEDEDISQLNETQLAKIRNKKVGFVFQTFNLLPRTSALDNVTLPLTYTGLNNLRQEKEVAKQFLQMVGLSKRINHYRSQLSGGEQQRVAIARALVNHPSIIFADEPTGNLDSKSGKEVMTIFQKLNQEGNTIVVVTHNPKIAEYAKRIIKIEDGKIKK